MSAKCQFCHSEVAPTAIASSVGATAPVALQSGPKPWQEIANTVLGILWIISGGLNLMMGIYGLVTGIALLFLGLGIIRQEWLPLMIARSICFLGGVYGLYLLIAAPFFRQAGSPISILEPLLLLAASGFQSYIFWCVSD
jgi:hypothetical protein